MFESLRKWLVKTLITPDDIGEYMANEDYLSEHLVKIPGGELKKTDTTKKRLLSKAIAIVEMKLDALEQSRKSGRNVEAIASNKQKIRLYKDQLELIEYREKQGYDEEQGVPEVIMNKASKWREQILVGDVESFLDAAFEEVGESRIENLLYNISGQYYSNLEHKIGKMITQEIFELETLDIQLNLLDFVDRIQAQRIA
ncbi:MAG: hypothetical protein KTR30_05870 [Saprospiraceae bacterium]|nr:hypothetical protein [Saprospiraceae bacterium]